MISNRKGMIYMLVKAVVAKIDQENGIMVVFTADKQFRRLPLPEIVPPLGAKVEVDLPAAKRAAGGLLHIKWLAAAAMLLVVLAIGMFSTMGVTPVSAYVTLDMKPSLQLSVDDRGKITEVTALNEAGKALLEQFDLKNMDIYQAVKELVQKSGKAGYFDGQSDNIVMASITSAKNSASNRIDENKLRTIIYDELSAKHYPGYVVVNVADKNQWQNAQKSGYSINQVIMSERASENGVEIDPKELKEQGLTQVIKDRQTDIPRWFGENSCEVTWPGRNSTVQPAASNNTRSTGEHESNVGHEDNSLQSSAPNNSQTAGGHEENEGHDDKALQPPTKQPVQVNTNTVNSETMPHDGRSTPSEQYKTTAAGTDGQHIVPAASYDDQNNHRQDSDSSESHSEDR